MLRVTSTHITQGASFARGTTVDEYLSDGDCMKLYASWLPAWPDKLTFSGGVTAITVELINEVPVKELTKVYGKAMAARLLKVCADNPS